MLKRISVWVLLIIYIAFPLTSISAARPQNFPRERRPCKPSARYWCEAEYLFWRFKASPEPVPLVVKGSLPSSNVVLGGKDIENNWRSGGKISVGHWSDNSQRIGGEVSVLFIPNGTTKKSVSSTGLAGSAILSVPYFDVVTGQENFTGVALPGVFKGTATLSVSNWMNSAEANMIVVVPQDCSTRLIWLTGLRYWGFEEKLSFKTDSPFIPPFPADVYRTTDHFCAANHFYGGQIAVGLEYICSGFFANMQVKAAFGTMHQKGDITGKLSTNDFNDFGEVQEFKGGYFTMPSNIKTRTTDCFAIIPEACVNIGYCITDRFKLQIGYSALYVNNVLKPGKLIERKINPTQSAALSGNPNPILIGEAKPKPALKSTTFYAQGLNAGFEFAF